MNKSYSLSWGDDFFVLLESMFDAGIPVLNLSLNDMGRHWISAPMPAFSLVRYNSIFLTFPQHGLSELCLDLELQKDSRKRKMRRRSGSFRITIIDN